ncbi:acyltransferase [Pseudoalteromonas rhizosphaerae]|uniref:acyltransferase n=1 Tax=Pseudoalteromonas rhizosphaerae TaxID=2518973 RepID=UPI002149110A|nr:acyltransferase [Pseudoalteromonas rhizosphaerae]
MERNVSLDFLKLFMAFMIVGLHAGFLSEFSKLGAYLFNNGIFRIAVPVFFVINGFYFYSTLIKNAQRIWFKRVIILYLVWMAFYSFFWFSIPDMSIVSVLKLALKFLMGYHHLWYISGLIGAAFTMLLLTKLSTKLIIMSIGATFLVGVLIQYTGNYHVFPDTYFDKVFNINWSHRNFLFFAFPFFGIGFLLNKYQIHKVVPNNVILLGTFLGLLMLFFESYINYYQPHRDGGFDNFLTLIFVCPLIFIYFQQQYIKGSTKNVALYSSAIYFIHSFVLSLLRKTTEFEGVSLTLLAIIISVITSVYIIILNKRVKCIL